MFISLVLIPFWTSAFNFSSGNGLFNPVFKNSSILPITSEFLPYFASKTFFDSFQTDLYSSLFLIAFAITSIGSFPAFFTFSGKDFLAIVNKVLTISLIGSFFLSFGSDT